MSDTYEDHFAQLTAQAGSADGNSGIFSVHIFGPDDFPPLYVAASRGDDSAFSWIMAIDEFLRRVPSQEMLCICCDAPMTNLPRAIGFLAPYRDDRTVVAGSPICCACYRDDVQEMQRAVFQALLRVGVFESGRILKVTDVKGGSA
jgi:hypothetical protein